MYSGIRAAQIGTHALHLLQHYALPSIKAADEPTYQSRRDLAAAHADTHACWVRLLCLSVTLHRQLAQRTTT